MLKVIEFIKNNEMDEYLTYFPEYKNIFDNLKKDIEIIRNELLKEIDLYNQKESTLETKKDKALFINTLKYKHYLFSYISNKNVDINDYIVKNYEKLKGL